MGRPRLRLLRPCSWRLEQAAVIVVLRLELQGGPPGLPRPTIQSTLLILRGWHRPQCAGMRLNPHQQGHGSHRSILSHVERDCGSERERAAYETACAGAVRSLHPKSLLSFRNRHSGRLLYVLQLTTRQTSVHRPDLLLPCLSVSEGVAPQMVCFHAIDSSRMRRVHHHHQHPSRLRGNPPPNRDDGLLTHHFFCLYGLGHPLDFQTPDAGAGARLSPTATLPRA